MEYTELKELQQEWMAGLFKYPEQINVAGVVYKLGSGPVQNFESIILNRKKAFVVYQTSTDYRDQAKKAGLNRWILLVWGVDPSSVVKPYDVRSSTPARAHGGTVQVGEAQELIGDVVIIKMQLPSGVAALKGKVDTGAEISSLHADDIKVVGGSVRFINKELSNNVISVPVIEKQAVKSADGGVEYRPVIELDIEINGKPVRKVMFNLNDREHMEYPCLVGQNILEKTSFLIDPKQDGAVNEQEETVDDAEWTEDFIITEETIDILNEQFKDLEPAVVEDESAAEHIKEVLAILENSNVSFAQLTKKIRTDSRNIIEDIDY